MILFIVNGVTIEIIDAKRRRRTLDVMVVVISAWKDTLQENGKETREDMLSFSQLLTPTTTTLLSRMLQ